MAIGRSLGFEPELSSEARCEIVIRLGDGVEPSCFGDRVGLEEERERIVRQGIWRFGVQIREGLRQV